MCESQKKRASWKNTRVGKIARVRKIAQVVKKFKIIHDNDTYFLEIGSNVDIAFICICAYAIDELYSDP